MKVNTIKKLIVFMLIAFLSACGGSSNGGNNRNYIYNDDASTSSFRPKTASEFESKFVNKNINPPSGHIITILPNSTIKQVIKNQTTGESKYTYENIGSNTVILKYMIDDIKCIVRLTWTSELEGHANEIYTSEDFVTNAIGNFFIDGKN